MFVASAAMASDAHVYVAESKEPQWVTKLPRQDTWHCIEPSTADVNIVSPDQKPVILRVPFGGLYEKDDSSLGDRREVRTLVIFTSEPNQPWYKAALKVGAGVAVGTVAVAAAPAVIGAGIGVTAAGPVAGGLIASKMAAGGGLAAGGALATAQSLAMGGIGGSAVAGGGVAGGLLSRVGFGRRTGNHCLENLPGCDVHIDGQSGKVYIGITVPKDSGVIVNCEDGRAIVMGTTVRSKL